MTITITAFERSPDGGKGLARDTRVRWALEEVGQPFEVRLLARGAAREILRRQIAAERLDPEPMHERMLGELGLGDKQHEAEAARVVVGDDRAVLHVKHYVVMFRVICGV